MDSEQIEKIDKIYNMSIASIILLSVPILVVGGVSLNYVLYYSHLTEKLEEIPNDIDKIMADVSFFKEKIIYILEKVENMNNKINSFG